MKRGLQNTFGQIGLWSLIGRKGWKYFKKGWRKSKEKRVAGRGGVWPSKKLCSISINETIPSEPEVILRTTDQSNKELSATFKKENKDIKNTIKNENEETGNVFLELIEILQNTVEDKTKNAKTNTNEITINLEKCKVETLDLTWKKPQKNLARMIKWKNIKY